MARATALPTAVTLVLAVLLPLCWGLARLVDRGIDEAGAKLTRVKDAEPPLSRREARGCGLYLSDACAGSSGVVHAPKRRFLST